MHTYQRENNRYAVGIVMRGGEFIPVTYCETEQEAQAMTSYLNGGQKPDFLKEEKSGSQND